MKLIKKLLGRAFPGSAEYWERRYQDGKDSGSGSYHRLAEFKAEVVNTFVAEQNVRSVIEFGSGDGNQLSLLKIPAYLGFDVSRSAIMNCGKRYRNDPGKSFLLYDQDAYFDPLRIIHADMTMSLDVIYHLVEDAVYEKYMRNLFSTADQFVMIYASDSEDGHIADHVRHRKFTRWVAENQPSWSLSQQIPNKYPYDRSQPDITSFADFFIFRKNS